MQSSSSLRNLTTKSIMDKIQRGVIRSDEIITVAGICAELGVSRTPVREALIELVADGRLKKIPQKGYIINEMDQKQKLNIYDILATLDALAAVRAMDGITTPEINKMNEYVELIDVAIKYRNYPSYCELQDQFHMVYINQCDNPLLVKMLDDLKSAGCRYTYYSENANKLFEKCALMNGQHRQIIRLFSEKKPEALKELLENIHWKTNDLDMI